MIPVRPLRPEDVEQVLALVAASAEVAAAGGHTAGQAAGWNRRAFADILANPEQGSCLIAEQDDAEHDGVVTGFACFRVTATGAECIFWRCGNRMSRPCVLMSASDSSPSGVVVDITPSPQRTPSYSAATLSTPAHAASQRLAEGRNGPDHLT